MQTLVIWGPSHLNAKKICKMTSVYQYTHRTVCEMTSFHSSKINTFQPNTQQASETQKLSFTMNIISHKQSFIHQSHLAQKILKLSVSQSMHSNNVCYFGYYTSLLRDSEMWQSCFLNPGTTAGQVTVT